MNDQQLRQLQQAWSALPGDLTDVVVLAVGAWMVVYPAGWLVAWLMKPKKQQLEAPALLEKHAINKNRRGFADGGRIIGRLERLLIHLFVISEAMGAVGFLIAAKSIFRFGELSDQENRLEAEYITIGTLMSFAVGLGIALGARYLLK